MQDQYLPSGTGDDSLDTPVDLNAARPVQHFAFGGIANPSQQAFLRDSDRRYLEARQAELDAFEQQRQAYNTALTTWQNEVYNPYVEQLNAYNTAAQKYNTDVYDPYKAQVDAYNEALAKYNAEVYDPYVQQYNAYEKAINEWNAGPKTLVRTSLALPAQMVPLSDYAGPAAPTLAREFGMTVPVQPEAFSMTAPTAPKDFDMVAPTLPLKEEDVIAYQQSAAQRAQKDADQRALAIDVASDPSRYNFGSMSVANRFMAKGGPVEKTAREMMDDMDGQKQDRLFERIYAPGTPPFGFAKGGEADIAAMRALVDASNMAEDEDEEEPINTDPVGTAQSMLSDLMASETPKTRTVSRVRKMPVGGGADRPKGMAVEYESLTTAKAAKPKGAKSAQAELRALAKSYRLKKQAAENAAKGLMSNTLGTPTLERPTLEQETLTKRRFAEGGEAKKGQKVEGSDGPSASALLRRLGLAVARGVPQVVTGLVDLAALPLTATGRMKAEDIVGTTDYLTKRGLLPKPQEGMGSEIAELLSSMASPGGAAKAAMLGIIGPKGIIEAARRSKLFKGPGMTVPEEKFSSAEMLRMLEDQGIDTNRMWLRGKKEDATTTPQYDYDTLEYLYNLQKRPDAVEAALRDSRRSQATQGRTLSRQPGDRSVTKFNTTGGVWLTESPSLAQTYAGERGYVIPVYAPKPDVKIDAKGEQWDDFYRKDKDWKEAFADPNVRLVEVRNIIDAGPHWTEMISPEASEEELRALLTATNLFAKKPFDGRVVNKLIGEPFEFKRGGAVKRVA